ncbi:MAG: phage tail protein [Kofleriaceae bacterium]|nr:phage tail protein [Myxococcales bacterium]MCB9563790.1 phage tail protein [Kofleriaceae bacterium]MCB9572646.1 phage tail protein [Kofleriaceae bacterium]
MALVYRNDPYGGFNFEVILTGVSDDGTAVRGSFAEVSGLEAEVVAIEYRNGSEEMRHRKLPGLAKYKAVTLKRGVIGDLALWNWIRRGVTGDYGNLRTDGSIILKNEAGQEVMRWNLTRAWASKYTGPSFNAKNSEVALETLEIQIERLEIDGQTV